jgi:hypothetical protein
VLFRSLDLLHRDEIIPARIAVSDKSPIDPEQKVEEKDERGHKMEKPDRPEPIAKGGFSADLEGQGPADNEAGRDQDAHAKEIDPVVKADGQFPNINSLHCRRSHKPLLKRVEVMDCAAFFVVQVHGTSQAGIEGMNCSEHLQGLLGIVDRRPDQRGFVG